MSSTFPSTFAFLLADIYKIHPQDLFPELSSSTEPTRDVRGRAFSCSTLSCVALSIFSTAFLAFYGVLITSATFVISSGKVYQIIRDIVGDVVRDVIQNEAKHVALFQIFG